MDLLIRDAWFILGSTRWTAGAVPFDCKNALRHGRPSGEAISSG